MVYNETFNLLLCEAALKILNERFDLRLSIAAFTDFCGSKDEFRRFRSYSSLCLISLTKYNILCSIISLQVKVR